MSASHPLSVPDRARLRAVVAQHGAVAVAGEANVRLADVAHAVAGGALRVRDLAALVVACSVLERKQRLAGVASAWRREGGD